MNRTEITDKLREIVADQMDVSMDAIHDETNFVTDLGADALDAVEILMTVEDEFELSISNDEAEHIRTFSEAVDFIAEKFTNS
jgi:acyl carrier protein